MHTKNDLIWNASCYPLAEQKDGYLSWYLHCRSIIRPKHSFVEKKHGPAKGHNVSCHDGSWHSDKVCNLVQKGLYAPPTTKFLNLNRPYNLRCLSPTKVTGVGVNAKVRAFYYANWKKWTNSTPPKRIVFECCAQCLASKHAIHIRPLSTWTKILRAIVHDRLGNNWEYLWPTLIDEDGTSQLSTC